MTLCQKYSWIVLVSLLSSALLKGQTISYKKSCLLEASSQDNPPAIYISWNLDFEATNYSVYKRIFGDSEWQLLASEIPPGQTSYTDVFVSLDESYEYKIEKENIFGLNYDYILSSTGVEKDFYQGKLLCLVEEDLFAEIEQELLIYQEDLRLNGWTTELVLISSSSSVTAVKEIITNIHTETALKSLLIVGDIAVPYSGNISPDGIPTHTGAWPTDGYYGNLEMDWTDDLIDNSSSVSQRNHNTPGDGKFDQSEFSGKQTLAVGRIDFSQLGDFGTASQLTKNYFNRLHLYKLEQIQPEPRCLIEDNLSSNLEALAKNMWKSASPIVGRDQIIEGDFSEDLINDSYLMAYLNGNCDYSSCESTISSEDFMQNDFQSVINVLYGGYFADWDNENNLLVSAISGGTNLISFWAGRPNWILHPLAMGLSVGECLKLTQDNTSNNYETGLFPREVHISLMGDPTLNIFPRKPVSGLELITDLNESKLSWINYDHPGLEAYMVFEVIEDSLVLIKTLSPDQTTFSLNCEEFNQEKEYLIRASIKEISKSGVFTHLNMGASIIATNEIFDPSIESDFTYVQNGNTINLNNNSSGYSELQWLLDGELFSTVESPVLTIEEPGLVTISLVSSNPCFSDTLSQEILITNTNDPEQLSNWTFWPNPNMGTLNYSGADDGLLSITNTKGELILQQEIRESGIIDLSHLTKGIYFIAVKSEEHAYYQKLIIL